MRLHLITGRRAFPELYHLPQTDPGSGEVIVVFDGIYQLFGSSPRHLGFLGLAASQSQAVPQGVAVSMSFADGIEAQGCRAPRDSPNAGSGRVRQETKGDDNYTISIELLCNQLRYINVLLLFPAAINKAQMRCLWIQR